MGRRYVAGWYDYREASVCLRQEKNRKVDTFPFPYYFFAENSERSVKLLYEICSTVEKDGKYLRCFCNASSEKRREVATRCENEGIRTYELDVNPINRFLNDIDFEFGEPKILFYDFETDARRGWGSIPEHEVLFVSWASSDGTNGHWLSDGNEKHLLFEFLRVVRKHDLLVAWNGDAYDEIVLKERCLKHNLADKWSVIWQSTNFLDLMLLFKKYYQRDSEGLGIRTSFSLENISQAALGEGKKKGFTVGALNPAKAIVDAFKERPEELVEYGKRDVELMVKLNEKFGHIEFHRILSNLCGRFLSSFTLKAGFLNDAYVLRYGKNRGVRFPTKWGFFADEEEHDKIEGAYVMDPKPGLYHGVSDLDFKSLYPNIMRSLNLSPELKTKKTEGSSLAFNGVRFDTTRKGIFSEIAAELLDLREKYRSKAKQLEAEGHEGSIEHVRSKQMSDACKVLANAMYGILASPHLRFFDPECGEAITVTARSLIQHVISYSRKEGLEAVYSDTDSAFFLCGKEEAEEFAKKVATELDSLLEGRGARPGFIRMDLDSFYERIFFVSKKRYAGIKDTGKIDIKGLEFIRSDRCKLARDLQKRVIDYILLSENPTIEGAMRISDRWKKRLFERKIEVEEIIITKSISKSLSEYKVKLPHVRIAEEMMKNGLEVFEGMKIPYYVVGKKGTLLVKHSGEYNDDYDAAYYWENEVRPPTEAVIEAVFKMKMNDTDELPFKQKNRGKQ
jgi:DNA polymerase elongation subunit (family B)